MNRRFICAFALSGCAVACSDDEFKTKVYEGTLDVEVTRAAAVSLDLSKERAESVTLTLREQGFGVIPADVAWNAHVDVHVFPEAGLTVFSAKFAVPPVAGGSCGNAPVSVALSLARRGESARVAGSLTAYCGENVFFGTPARILRVSGNLPRK